ncbi:hypothetical protein NL676_022124 [Syzygium grande]|nr:hypothetical protein NL676_022124 [Syzygium grande]
MAMFKPRTFFAIFPGPFYMTPSCRNNSRTKREDPSDIELPGGQMEGLSTANGPRQQQTINGTLAMCGQQMERAPSSTSTLLLRTGHLKKITRLKFTCVPPFFRCVSIVLVLRRDKSERSASDTVQVRPDEDRIDGLGNLAGEGRGPLPARPEATLAGVGRGLALPRARRASLARYEGEAASLTVSRIRLSRSPPHQRGRSLADAGGGRRPLDSAGLESLHGY